MKKPLPFIVVSFALGILMCRYVRLDFIYVWPVAVCLLFASVYRSKYSFVFLLCSFLLLGFIWTKRVYVLPKDHVVHVGRFYRGEIAKIKGVIVSDVRVQEGRFGIKTSFVLRLKRIKSPWGWKEKSGKIFVNVFRPWNVSYGDEVLLSGKLHRPYNFSGDSKFSYKEYLKTRGMHYMLSVKKDASLQIISRGHGHRLKAKSLAMRNHLKEVLNKHLTKSEAGIMKAMLLGDRSFIPSHVRELFVRTGVVHILAISGLHIGVVVFVFLVFLKLLPISRAWQYFLAIVLLISYAFLTGGRPSVIRATTMAVILLSSFILEREPNILNTLSLAALCLLIYNPFYLFDIGFQLSFICVLSLITIRPKIEDLVVRKRKISNRFVRFFIQSFTASLAVWIGISGVLAYYFEMITPIVVIANLFIIPLMAALVSLGIGLLLVGSFVPILAAHFAICLKFILNVMAIILFLMDQIPGAHFYVRDVTLWMVFGYYLVVFTCLFGSAKSIPPIDKASWL